MYIVCLLNPNPNSKNYYYFSDEHINSIQSMCLVPIRPKQYYQIFHLWLNPKIVCIVAPVDPVLPTMPAPMLYSYLFIRVLILNLSQKYAVCRIQFKHMNIRCFFTCSSDCIVNITTRRGGIQAFFISSF